MGGDVWAEFGGAEGVAYLAGVFWLLAEEGDLTVGGDGAVWNVLTDDGGSFVEVHRCMSPFYRKYVYVKYSMDFTRIKEERGNSAVDYIVGKAYNCSYIKDIVGKGD